MSLFGAARLYVVGADRMEHELAPSDGGSVSPRRDGAWALWAKMGAFPDEAVARPRLWRVQPGPVRRSRGPSVRA